MPSASSFLSVSGLALSPAPCSCSKDELVLASAGVGGGGGIGGFPSGGWGAGGILKPIWITNDILAFATTPIQLRHWTDGISLQLCKPVTYLHSRNSCFRLLPACAAVAFLQAFVVVGLDVSSESC